MIYTVTAILLAFSWAISLVAVYALGQMCAFKRISGQRAELFGRVIGFFEGLKNDVE